jgi:metallo-beta-lactamase family protein
MARLTFHGATEGVTGSLYLLETQHSRILLECGLVQGHHTEEARNREPFPFEPGSLDAMVLSHAHLDHSGRLPKLVAEGGAVALYMTPPTSDLIEIMLKDAAFLEQRDVEWQNRRHRRAGKKEIEPLFTIDDVQEVLALRTPVKYRTPVQITEDVTLRFHDAGHILGSAIVELTIREGGQEKKLVFSGDLGNKCQALLRDPAVIEQADVLLMESTYGDRDHRGYEDTIQEFEDIIVEAGKSGGNVLIPSFAVGRTQEILFHLGNMFHKGILAQQAVYLDSPMAIAATEVYQKYPNVINREDKAIMHSETSVDMRAFLPVLHFSHSTEESMAINEIVGGAIIIAGSGMCTGGRIRHHFKHNLWREKTHVVIVGFQAMGTPGRALVDGTERFRFAGEEIAVNAKIHTLGGFSAHASQTQLLEWAGNFTRPRPALYLIHGEPDAKQVLQQKLSEQGWQANIPQADESITF